jgi:Protein of unknown function (DUF3575)
MSLSRLILIQGRKLVFISIFLLSCLMVEAQSKDSVRRMKIWKNIIKVNLTSNVIYRSPLIEYERIVKKNQSFSVQVGLIALPFGSSRNSDSLHYQSSVKKIGYSATVDYRFYLAKENKDPAPHGVYIGPYVSYYHFDNERNMQIGNSPEPLLLKSKLDIISIGGQLGYQFVLGKRKRWTIDCIVIGPSITKYKVDMSLNGTIDPSQINDDLSKILQGVANQFPLVGNLLNKQTVNFTGKAETWSAGLRYSIHAGFRF